MGTFDYMNMRLNGYQFHMDLAAHKETWDQKKVSDVFDTWTALLPVPEPERPGHDLAGLGEVPRRPRNPACTCSAPSSPSSSRTRQC